MCTSSNLISTAMSPVVDIYILQYSYPTAASARDKDSTTIKREKDFKRIKKYYRNYNRISLESQLIYMDQWFQENLPTSGPALRNTYKRKCITQCKVIIFEAVILP